MSFPFPTSNQPPAFTFVLHDAGETKALTPVMNRLEQTGVSYRILATGTARSLLGFNSHLAPLPQDIVTLSQQGNPQAYSAQQDLNNAMSAPNIVTGLVSPFQAQWASYFKAQGKRVIGYFDGLNLSLDPLKNKATQFVGRLSELMTPTKDTAEGLKSQGFSSIPVSVVGQPGIEAAMATMAGSNPIQTKQQMGLNQQWPTFTFIGQHGPQFQAALRVFCETANTLPNANILLALHPSSTGIEEQQILAQYNTSGNIKVLPPQTIPTEHVVACSDIVIGRNSTMLFPARLMGKKTIVIGADPTAQTFEPLQHYALAPNCYSPAQLTQSIYQAAMSPTPTEAPEIAMQRIRLPTNSVGRVMASLWGM